MRLRRAPGPRPNRLPAAVRDALALERGERPLAVAPTRGGSYVVATSAALHLPTTSGGFSRLPWERVDQASWKDGRLHVRTTAGGPGYSVGLTDPGSVPETVRERVTATIVVNHHARLPGGGAVRIAGRRPPGGGEVRWSFVFEAGLDPSDPGLRAQAEQILDGGAVSRRGSWYSTGASSPRCCPGIRSRAFSTSSPALPLAAPASSSPRARSTPAVSWTVGFSISRREARLICSYRSRPALVPRT
jgi:hypothetical protein